MRVLVTRVYCNSKDMINWQSPQLYKLYEGFVVKEIEPKNHNSTDQQSLWQHPSKVANRRVHGRFIRMGGGSMIFSVWDIC